MTVATEVTPEQEEAEILEAGYSIIQIKVGNEVYNARKAHRCRVCQSPHRFIIEGEVLKGTTYTAIAEYIEGWPTGLFPAPGARSMSYHMRANHAPIKHIEHRKLMERIREEDGTPLEEGITSLVDKVVLAHAVIDRAHERLVTRQIEPSLQDAAAASRFLAEWEHDHDGRGITEEVWRQALYAYMEVLAPEIAPDRRDAVSLALENHPTLKMVKSLLAEQREPVQGEIEG